MLYKIDHLHYVIFYTRDSFMKVQLETSLQSKETGWVSFVNIWKVGQE